MPTGGYRKRKRDWDKLQKKITYISINFMSTCLNMSKLEFSKNQTLPKNLLLHALINHTVGKKITFLHNNEQWLLKICSYVLHFPWVQMHGCSRSLHSPLIGMPDPVTLAGITDPPTKGGSVMGKWWNWDIAGVFLFNIKFTATALVT